MYYVKHISCKLIVYRLNSAGGSTPKNKTAIRNTRISKQLNHAWNMDKYSRSQSQDIK